VGAAEGVAVSVGVDVTVGLGDGDTDAPDRCAFTGGVVECDPPETSSVVVTAETTAAVPIAANTVAVVRLNFMASRLDRRSGRV
jgi:hypothetical protein